MILFFDTSALVKFFHREEGTDVVISLITDPGNRVWVSELARLEFVCALHRRYRMKEIDEDQLTRALDGFSSEFSRFNTSKIGSAVLDEAETLVNRLGKSMGLRALDAIHLATFSLFNQLEEMPFVATDEILLTTARSLRAKIINPLHGPEIISP
jgi:predicted nucleic acid-binding protein